MKSAVLRVISESNDAIDPHELFEAVHAEDMASFANTVRELEQDGKVVVTKKGKVISAKSSGLTPARIVSESKNFAFARPLDGGEDVYIPVEGLKRALPGDIVMLHRLHSGEKGMDGMVERILVKGSRLITGTVIRRRSVCELMPDSDFRFNIDIERGGTLGARDGDKVQVMLSSKPRRREITARVTKIYGRSDSAKICSDAIIDANGIPTEFPAEAAEAARRIALKGVSKEDMKGRLDLRGELIFTIDGADAKDLDDAVSVQKVEGGWRLGVHIADVSHYVTENSPIDKEARRRGTSVYFADRVIPMLPKELSNGICSLNAGEDKLTFSALMQLDPDGRLVSYEFKKSVICSTVRGVYSEINRILDHTADSAIMEKYQPVMQSIAEGEELAQILQRRAQQRGTMDLESAESRFELNEQGICVHIYPRVQGESEKMIEQFMITANQAAAIYAKNAQVPFVYRVHEAPDPERVRILSQLAGALGLKNRRLREGVRTGDFAALLEQAKETPAARLISQQVLRTMAKARYDFRPMGHFGLSLSDYCHFTSPIRRYPDTAIHRILTDLVSGTDVNRLQKRYTEFAAAAASTSSLCEVRAMRAERDAEKCYMAEYMTQHIGEQYDGIISGVTARGFFVELANSVEGFVSLEHYPEYDFQFDGLTCHTDKGGRCRLAVGDKVRIRAVSADVATGMIDFAPAE